MKRASLMTFSGQGHIRNDLNQDHFRVGETARTNELSLAKFVFTISLFLFLVSISTQALSTPLPFEYCKSVLTPDRTIDLSSDGQRYLTLADGIAQLWQSDPLKSVATLNGHSELITSKSFSPNNKYLATGSKDNTIKIWDANQGQFIRNLLGHEQAITQLQFSMDSSKLGSLDEGGTLILWFFTEGSGINPIEIQNHEIREFLFSPDGQWIAFRDSREDLLRIISTKTAEIQLTLNISPIYQWSWKQGSEAKMVLMDDAGLTIEINPAEPDDRLGFFKRIFDKPSYFLVVEGETKR